MHDRGCILPWPHTPVLARATPWPLTCTISASHEENAAASFTVASPASHAVNRISGLVVEYIFAIPDMGLCPRQVHRGTDQCPLCTLLYDQKNNQSCMAAIAQLGERQTEDLKVPGSIPGLGITHLC